MCCLNVIQLRPLFPAMDQNTIGIGNESLVARVQQLERGMHSYVLAT